VGLTLVDHMRLVFLLNNRRSIGGGEMAVYRYAASLAQRGHEVTVFAVWHNDFMRKVHPPGMRLRLRRGLPAAVRGAGRFNKWWGRLYARLVIEPWLRRERPDFICGYLRQAASEAWRYGRRYRIRTVQFVFETPQWLMRELGDLFPPQDIAMLEREWAAVREAYVKADALIPLSETAGAECRRWVEREVTRPVYPGVDPTAPLRFAVSENHVLYVGRLDAYKNIQDLIRAMALIENPPLLVIAGSGYEEADLRRLAEKLGVPCRFTGTVSEDGKWRLLREAYFLVFPSSFEGFGIPPAEALAAEKPAVCSDIPVLREVYGDAVEYFPLHDVAALAGTMRRLLRDAAYRRRRGSEGRRFVEERYTWEKAGAALEGILRETLSRSGGRRQTYGDFQKSFQRLEDREV